MTAARVLYLLDSLKQQKQATGSLVPNPATDALLSELTALAQRIAGAEETATVAALADVLEELYSINAEGESALEQHWGERIQRAPDPRAELRRFPYWDSYLKLTQLEVTTLRRAHTGVQRVLFVGSGPLPLTAYIMATEHGLSVTNLDVDGDANCCAAGWMERLLGDVQLPCVHMDVMNYTDFGNYDAVVLAAMVGLDVATKQLVLHHLHRHLRPDQTLLVRSGSLLYPQLTAEHLAGFNVTRAVFPQGDVISSVLLARKAA